MLILYAISIASFLALIVAGVAIVHHGRAGRRQEEIAAPPEPSFREHLHAASEFGSVRTPRQIHQTVETITANKAWNKASQAVEIHPARDEETVAGRRKAPQKAALQRTEDNSRADWTHFNKDYGDLTDPNPSRAVRAASSGTSPRRPY